MTADTMHGMNNIKYNYILIFSRNEFNFYALIHIKKVEYEQKHPVCGLSCLSSLSASGKQRTT
jgi:hypothetical protein